MKIGGCEAAWGYVFAVNDHQLFTCLFVQKVYEADIHHRVWQVIALRFNQRLDVLDIATGPHISIFSAHPRVEKEVFAAKVRMRGEVS